MKCTLITCALYQGQNADPVSAGTINSTWIKWHPIHYQWSCVNSSILKKRTALTFGGITDWRHCHGCIKYITDAPILLESSSVDYKAGYSEVLIHIFLCHITTASFFLFSFLSSFLPFYSHPMCKTIKGSRNRSTPKNSDWNHVEQLLRMLEETPGTGRNKVLCSKSSP